MQQYKKRLRTAENRYSVMKNAYQRRVRDARGAAAAGPALAEPPAPPPCSDDEAAPAAADTSPPASRLASATTLPREPRERAQPADAVHLAAGAAAAAGAVGGGDEAMPMTQPDRPRAATRGPVVVMTQMVPPPAAPAPPRPAERPKKAAAPAPPPPAKRAAGDGGGGVQHSAAGLLGGSRGMLPPPIKRPRQAPAPAERPSGRQGGSPPWKQAVRQQYGGGDGFDLSPGAPLPLLAAAAPVRGANAAGADPRIAAAAAGGAPPPGEYRYQEVVRSRDARSKLPGFECQDCRLFYSALQSWGDMRGGTVPGAPACGHTSAPGGGGGGGGGGGMTRQQALDAASRHRYQYEPPATPQGYWDIGFTPADPVAAEEAAKPG